MHIAEGYLPLGHALAWHAANLPLLAAGVRRAERWRASGGERRTVLLAAGAFCLLLSAIKLPSVAGSSSHPTGVALGTLLVGPALMALIGTIVLLLQALLMAHGGLSTLGANAIAMAVVGPWVAWAVLHLCRRTLGDDAALAVATVVGVLATYATTALQLALAFPDPVGGVRQALVLFLGVFAVTQVPLAVVEAAFTVLVARALVRQGITGIVPGPATP